MFSQFTSATSSTHVSWLHHTLIQGNSCVSTYTVIPGVALTLSIVRKNVGHTGIDLKPLSVQPESLLTELANIGVVANYKVIFSLGLNLLKLIIRPPLTLSHIRQFCSRRL